MKPLISITCKVFIVVLLSQSITYANSEVSPSLMTAWNMVRDGKVLPGIMLAERLYNEKKIRSGDYAQLLTIVGDERGAEKIMARPNSNRTLNKTFDHTELSTMPALDAIMELAKDKRIVILNESHYDQRHRAFAHLLALRLRKIGFTHFAAETFTTTVVDSMEDGAPDNDTGVYVADPVYADLVRQAVKSGYTVFPYEETQEQSFIAQQEQRDERFAREETQAKNLLMLLRDVPDSRIFIYVGGSHILESPDANGLEWMAALLKQYSGIDPLTVDQIAGTPHVSRGREFSIYRHIEPLIGPRTSVVFNLANQPVRREGVDLITFHPDLTEARTERPAWLHMCGYRLPFDITVEPDDDLRLIRAFIVGEPSGSIPIDQVILPAGAASASLLMPTGEYRIEIQSRDGMNSILDAEYSAVRSNASPSLDDYRHAMSCQ